MLVLLKQYAQLDGWERGESKRERKAFLCISMSYSLNRSGASNLWAVTCQKNNVSLARVNCCFFVVVAWIVESVPQ